MPVTVGLLLPQQAARMVPSVLTWVLARHSNSFALLDCISIGVDRMQRSFEPIRQQVGAWQRVELRDVTAEVVVIYEAFVEGRLEAPKHLSRSVHHLYFEAATCLLASRAFFCKSRM